MPITIPTLTSLLTRARSSRREIAKFTPSYRLFHGAADGIAGFDIDVFNREVFFLRTRSAQTDALIEPVTGILKSEFDARAVWLKNHFSGRSAQGLELSDRVLFGPIPDGTEEIQDAGFRFRWKWDREDIFPLEDRPLRLALNRHLDAEDSCRSVLCAGFEAPALIAAEKTGELRVATPDPRGLKIADATGVLRDLADENERFDALALDFTFVRNVEKNKTALFHFWNATFALLNPKAPLFIKTAHAAELAALLSAFCGKKGRALRILKMESADGDFPELPTKRAPFTAYVRVEEF